MMNAALSKFSTVAEPEPSATLARVAFVGDDGYGAGTVGQPGGSGGEQCYKAENEIRERQAAEARELAELGSVVRLLAAPALGSVQ
jgi:hypothetical protein